MFRRAKECLRHSRVAPTTVSSTTKEQQESTIGAEDWTNNPVRVQLQSLTDQLPIAVSIQLEKLNPCRVLLHPKNGSPLSVRTLDDVGEPTS